MMIHDNVFVLQHVHSTADDVEDVKLIGVYSSREEAQAAIERLASRPGFSDARDGFSIDRYRINQDQWSEGFVTLMGA